MNDKHLRYIKNNYLDLFDNELFCDFSIRVNEDVFHCHKCILYCGSEYFKGCLNFNPNSTDINFSDDLTATGIKNCLIFLYKLGCDSFVSDEQCEETYIAADFLQISALKSVASEKISGNINCQNAFSIVQFSIIYNDTSLRLKAQNFINNNFNKLCFDSEDFQSLQFDLVSEIVSDSNLSSTDFLIMKALLKWVTYDLANRQTLLEKNVENLVQLHLISNEQWNNFAKEVCCLNIVEHIRQKSKTLNFYSDKPHRIGTPIVLYCVGSSRSDRLDSNNNFFCVDKSTNQLPQMQEDRLNHKICSSSTFIFVIGGESPVGYMLKSCERYNLVERTWSPMAELDCYRSNFAVACLEGYVYLIGGSTVTDSEPNCKNSDNILIYDSGSDTWQITIFKTPCVMIDAVAVGHCGLIYVAGGVNDSNRPTNKIMEFDPTTGDWTKLSVSGIPEDIFNEDNIKTLSIAAGGSTVENDGFLLICGRLNNIYMVYGYHFSLNRWRLSTQLDELENDMMGRTHRVMIYCQREFIGILSTCTAHFLEQLRLPIPNTDHFYDDLLLFHKFKITNDWSGEIVLMNHCNLNSFSAKSGFQFLLAALVNN